MVSVIKKFNICMVPARLTLCFYLYYFVPRIDRSFALKCKTIGCANICSYLRPRMMRMPITMLGFLFFMLQIEAWLFDMSSFRIRFHLAPIFHLILFAPHSWLMGSYRIFFFAFVSIVQMWFWLKCFPLRLKMIFRKKCPRAISNSVLHL